jgi:group I intron endonuclease
MSWNKVVITAELRYSGNSKHAGIYSIVNKLNGRMYIGSTHWFEDRWMAHLRALRKNNHHNRFLQNDFNKSGECNFVFDIVEVVPGNKVSRLEREQYYLNKLFAECSNTQRYNHYQIAVIPASQKFNIKKYREDRDWFIGPDGKEYVVEDIIRFCGKYNLDHNEIKKLVTKEVLDYRQWRMADMEFSSRIIVNRKNGIEEEVFNPSVFAKKHGVNQSHISKLLSGVRKSCGSWVVKNRIFVDKPHSGKVYKILSPTGNVVEFNNLENFSRENNMERTQLYNLAKGTQWYYKGWTAYGITKEMIFERKAARYDSIAKSYTMINPEGHKVTFKNISQFCKVNGLRKQSMINLSSGKIKSYKGWTMPVNIVE